MEKVWVHKQGDNDDDGLKDSPVATVNEAIARSQTNGEVVVGDGQYDENTELSWPGMVVRPQTPGSVILKGHQRLAQRAIGAGFRGMRLHGGTDCLNKGFGPLMYGDHQFIDACEVTNFDATIGVHVQNYYGVAPVGARITRSRIHHCGERSAANNYDHGIYLGVCKDVIVRGNWIHDNARRGVQCYSDADRVLVENNTFVANNQNMHFGGSDTATSDYCTARRNVIAYGREWNLDSSYAPSRIGVGNVATENWLWMEDGSDGIKEPTTGFTISGNVVVKPEFVDLDGRDLTIKGAAWQAFRLPKWLRELDGVA